jgi:hypothetical protein
MSPSGPLNSGWIDGRMSHPLHGRWAGMIDRCYSPVNSRYADYGGRGIYVCGRWRDSFWAFVADMGPCPPGMSLDRIDNDGPYAPWNCRWATTVEQNNNRRPRRLPETCGKGHLFDPANTRIRPDGQRACRACHAAGAYRRRHQLISTQ